MLRLAKDSEALLEKGSGEMLCDRDVDHDIAMTLNHHKKKGWLRYATEVI